MYTTKEVQGLLKSYPELKEKRETHSHGLTVLCTLADLHKALGRMPHPLWMAVTFHGILGVTARHLGEKMEVPKSTVSDHYWQGIDWIVRFLNEGEA